MNILKESLFSSSTAESTPRTKKTRRNHSKTNRFNQDYDTQSSEPLLSTSQMSNGCMELMSIDSDEDDDKTKLSARRIVRSRTTKSGSGPAAHGGGSIVIVEKPILPQETIQAFAIRYRVPVSQLKRLNNLQNDQDFYALKHCRVPVRRFGLLHEPSSSITVDLDDQLNSNASLSINRTSQDDHRAFLKAMDIDLASMRTKVEQFVETPPITATLIQDQPKRNMMIRTGGKPISDLNCDGADCGCKFWHILLVILLIALFIPLIYIYIYTKNPHGKSDRFSTHNLI